MYYTENTLSIRLKYAMNRSGMCLYVFQLFSVDLIDMITTTLES